MPDDPPDRDPGPADDGPRSAGDSNCSDDTPTTAGTDAAAGDGPEESAGPGPVDGSGPGGLAFTPDDDAVPTRITVAPERGDDDATAWITVDAGLVIDLSDHI